MLTRLKVSGFKNLVNVDVRFGPFTCIAGANGVGKSNLFDAIKFLSALADSSLVEAAFSVRDERGGESTRTGDIRSLFHRVGDTYAEKMSFEAEMIVPAEGIDNLGQPATATITFLRYSLELAYRQEDILRPSGSLELLHEGLVHINLGDARESLAFPHKPDWRQSAIQGRRGSPFISTEGEGAARQIKIHQDDGTTTRSRTLLATNLPRTVLSDANADESPTVLLVRREMQSWRLLQLEPPALRRPDEFTAPTQLGTDGAHLASTLYYLARLNAQQHTSDQEKSGAHVGNDAEPYSSLTQSRNKLVAFLTRLPVFSYAPERRALLRHAGLGHFSVALNHDLPADSYVDVLLYTLETAGGRNHLDPFFDAVVQRAHLMGDPLNQFNQLRTAYLSEPSDPSSQAAVAKRLAQRDADLLDLSHTYGQVANQLAQLLDDVREVWIDRDERRELLTLHVTGRDGTAHPARALSDGTLRFLALAVLELDPEAKGVICLEEPENGIHPERIPAMLDLLQAIAIDVDEPVDLDNPLRQVIINTHSPAVVGQVADDSLLVAELKEDVQDGKRFKHLVLSCLPDTWRARAGVPVVAKGKLLAYLNPIAHPWSEQEPRKRVVDHPDLKKLLRSGAEK